MGDATCRTLSNCVWAPAVQWIAPVNAFEHVTQLRHGDCDHPIGGQRPDKAAALQSLGVKRHAETVMPEDLDQIATPTAEHQQIAGVGISPQPSCTCRANPFMPRR